MAKVTKSFQQYKKGKESILESSLSITVEYDVHANEVEKILSVEVYNYGTKVTTDVTAIFAEQFSSAFEEMISAVDWREEYVLQLESEFEYDAAD